MKYWTRRTLLSLLSVTATSAAFGQTIRPKPAPNRNIAPPPSLASILATFAPKGTHAIVVVDVKTGRILEGSNADRPMMPASVNKALTSLYALRNLGSGFRFQTRLIGSGKISGGVLQGDLTLVGGGDPLLDTDGLGAMAEALRAKGVTRVAGKFRIYSSALPYQRVVDKEQPDHVGYNPSISGMNLNFNRVFFQWRRATNGYDLSMIAKGKKYAPVIRGIRSFVTNRDTPIYEYALAGGRDTWSVASDALGKGGSRWLPTRNPADYTGEVFRAVAAANGISMPAATDAKSIPKGVVLASQTGAELAPLLRGMLRFSTNITAEVIGLHTSTRKGRVKTLNQSGAAMSTWLKQTYRVRTAKLVDHSGLGAASRISASDMASILHREGWNGPLRVLMKVIDLRNADWKKAPIPGVKITAKTGTLNFVSALSGYVECPNGRQLAFAIFSANEGARARITPDKRERPTGAKTWARQSRILQHQLLRRWALTYGGK